MKPVVICRFAPHEGPGYFGTYLSKRGIPWRMIRIDEGEPLPPHEAISGVAMMGGPMSVNDDLPWISPMLDLVRAAVAADVPVIGHCLGGQLLSRALGGTVTRNHVKEIGWGEVEVLDDPAAAHWGATGSFLSYHWHGETFSIPHGATRIWSSTHCANQAFVLGRHLGMQCHIEITAELIDDWCETGAQEIESNLACSAAVQTAEAMHKDLDSKLEALRAVADRVYDRWTAGLKG
ncbi:MAG TPA: type 1 glutamine amidotransferase [Pyrinomonadaceae bacterium]|nr:type 1 glutamine amidotransferase [Pyrinomonadaceae bacterium]